MKNTYYANTNQKRAGVAVLKLAKAGLKAKKIAEDRESYDNKMINPLGRHSHKCVNVYAQKSLNVGKAKNYTTEIRTRQIQSYLETSTLLSTTHRTRPNTRKKIELNTIKYIKSIHRQLHPTKAECTFFS